MTAIHIGTHCLRHAHDAPEKLAMEAHRVLEGVEYDTLVSAGMSGALVLPILALGLRKNKLLVRKPGDVHRHHDQHITAEGYLGDRWVFVDDGMVTGETFQYVRGEVEHLARKAGKITQFAGAY